MNMVTFASLFFLTTFIVVVIVIIDTFYLAHNSRLTKLLHHAKDRHIRKSLNRALAKVKTWKLDHDELVRRAERHSNLAISYTQRWKKHYSLRRTNRWDDQLVTCDVKPPTIERIGFNNIHWQSIINSPDLTFYLYSAYFDTREPANKVRVIGSSDHFNQLNNMTLWCLLFFDGRRQSILTRVNDIVALSYDFKNFYKRKGYYLPLMLTCDLPESAGNLVPKAVSIKTSDDCDERLDNLMRVVYERPETDPKNEIGVCVRAIYYQTNDLSLRLIEWMELTKMMGADKIFFYSLAIHPNMKKVLDYYQKKEWVDWRYTTLPGLQPSDKYLTELYVKRMGNKMLPQETLELNDCLYRNMNKYRYLALLDIDEVIVPVRVNTWTELLKQITNESIINKSKIDKFGSYVFTQTRVYGDLETEEHDLNHKMYTMRHLHRTNFSGNAPKSFHLTKNIKVIWNHSPVKCLPEGSKCELHWVKHSIGYMLHFRTGVDRPKDCSDDVVKKCAVYDPILLRYRDQLATKMKVAIKKIWGKDQRRHFKK